MEASPENFAYTLLLSPDFSKPDGLAVVDVGTVARTIPDGRVLDAHNHVRHTINMTQSRNGFRAWTWPKEKKPRHFVRCNCGWSGLPHSHGRNAERPPNTHGRGLLSLHIPAKVEMKASLGAPLPPYDDLEFRLVPATMASW
jgi:hypothetical protein